MLPQLMHIDLDFLTIFLFPLIYSQYNFQNFIKLSKGEKALNPSPNMLVLLVIYFRVYDFIEMLLKLCWKVLFLVGRWGGKFEGLQLK